MHYVPLAVCALKANLNLGSGGTIFYVVPLILTPLAVNLYAISLRRLVLKKIENLTSVQGETLSSF